MHIELYFGPKFINICLSKNQLPDFTVKSDMNYQWDEVLMKEKVEFVEGNKWFDLMSFTVKNFIKRSYAMN